MSDIHKPSGEKPILSSFNSKSEERQKHRYEVKATFGSNSKLVIIESYITAQELLKYYVALIHSGKQVYLIDVENNDRLAYTVCLNNADAFTVAAVHRSND